MSLPWPASSVTLSVDNVHHIGVIAKPADHRVDARSAVKPVVARIAGEDIGQGIARGIDIIGADQGQVLEIGVQAASNRWTTSPGRCRRSSSVMTISRHHPPHRCRCRAPPFIASAPAPPSMTLARPSPVSVSAWAEPMMFSKFLIESPWASPPVRIEAIAPVSVTVTPRQTRHRTPYRGPHRHQGCRRRPCLR